jgi:tetratricopeptide (TPR) repeat protein
MKPDNNVESADAVLKAKNTIWAFPYLAVMGLIWGYLAGASSGAIVGLAAAAAVSVMLGLTTSIFTATPGKGSAITRFVPAGSTMGLGRHRSADLNVVRYHRLCHQFDDALIKVEEVLAKDPDFVEGLFLKAQILREGFEDGKAARKCLQKILAVAPDEKAVFHRWALNLYQELSEE